jgi:hypothetical protein
MTSPAQRDSVLDVLGFLSGVEPSAGWSSATRPAPTHRRTVKSRGVYGVIEAMALVSRPLATDLANGTDSQHEFSLPSRLLTTQV